MPKIMHGGLEYGGAAGAPMWSVQYYAGNTFLHREYVRNGDNALYTYDHDQWSTTDGGEPDPNAKTNITQDKTLYYCSGDLYIVRGNTQISNIEKNENTPGAIVVDVQSDLVKVTSTNNNNGAYGAQIDVTDYDYAVLELDYCTNVYSYFGIGTNFSYNYGGNQVAKAALSNKTSPYRWVVDISSYTGMYYCYISCGGNARFDIKKMFLTNDVYQQGDIT